MSTAKIIVVFLLLMAGFPIGGVAQQSSKKLPQQLPQIDSWRLGQMVSIDASITVKTNRMTRRLVNRSLYTAIMAVVGDEGIDSWNSTYIGCSTVWSTGNTVYGYTQITLDWDSSKLDYFMYGAGYQTGPKESFSTRVEVHDIPMWTDGKNAVIDVPAALLDSAHINASYNWHLEHQPSSGLPSESEYVTSIDRKSARFRIVIGEPLFVSVPDATPLAKDFQVLTNPIEHTTVFAFASSHDVQMISVYNTLGQCIREIAILPGRTYERVPFTSLPSGHYIARLGNQSHSFAVWR